MTGIILAHGKAADCVFRHMPNWQAAFSEIILISPTDDPLPNSCQIGTSCRNGQGIMDRMFFAAVMASRFDRCAVLEYDALAFINLDRLEVLPGAMLCSTVFQNDDDQFAANTYGHCPWIATGEDWWKIVRAGADYQGGNNDRWLAQACDLAGITQFGTINSFSTDRQWTEELILEARQSRLDGAIFIHGVKSAEVFDRIASATSEVTPP